MKVVFLTVLFLGIPHFTAAEDAFTSLHPAAEKCYRESDYPQAAELLADSADIEAKLLFGLLHREQYALYKSRVSKDKYKQMEDILEVDLGFEDVKTLLYYAGIPSKPEGNKMALDLLKHVLDQPMSPESCRRLGGHIGNDAYSLEAREQMLKAVEGFCKNVRAYVDKGGRMPTDVKTLFEDENFLGILVDALAVEGLEGEARDALEYIEEPSLAVLERREKTGPVLETIAGVKKQVEKRRKKFPESSWYSAYPDLKE